MLNDLLHVGVLCSKRAPGLDALLRHPLRGSLYEVKCVVTSEANFSECAFPVLAHPIHEFYDENHAPLHDQRVRRFYDGETVLILHRFGVDTVLLLGYLYVITEPLLSAFPDRIFNVHDGSPSYPGLHATRDAILAGEEETHSIVHIVTREVDSGPVVASSRALRVAPFVREAVAAGENDIVRAYAYAHREWMMRSSWGDLVVRALEQAAACKEVAV
jgi:folate-dependent phosphoribosylglycinamide formyltransferase PurN